MTWRSDVLVLVPSVIFLTAVVVFMHVSQQRQIDELRAEMSHAVQSLRWDMAQIKKEIEKPPVVVEHNYAEDIAAIKAENARQDAAIKRLHRGKF